MIGSISIITPAIRRVGKSTHFRNNKPKRPLGPR